MKRLLYILFILAGAGLSVQAQPSDSRTAATKIADLLAQQPAETKGRFDEVMAQLEKFSAQDIAALLQQLTPPGTGDNAGIEYATNSYSYHVLQPGKESSRKIFVSGAAEALTKTEDKDNKAYIIQLLQNAGRDDAVEILATYLGDEYLSGNAARALATIGGDLAGEALMQSLPSSSGNAALHLINALGFMKYGAAESLLMQKFSAADPQQRESLWYALSAIGGAASEPLLRQASRDAGYGYGTGNATDAYLNYASGLLEKGETRLASRVANTVFKGANRPDQIHVRIAALDLLTQLHGTRQSGTLLKGAKDGNTLYRHASLILLDPYLDPATVNRLLRGLPREDGQVQIDIIQYLAANGQTTALPTVRELLSSSAFPQVRHAAVQAWYTLGGESVLGELVDELPKQDSTTKESIKEILLVADSDNLVPLLTSALANEQDPQTQIVLLEVLGNRGASESTPIIFDLLGQEHVSGKVRTTAYGALVNTANPEDLDNLLNLLVRADEDHVSYVQRAIVSAVNRSSQKDEYTATIIAQIPKGETDEVLKYFPVLAGVGSEQALSFVSSYLDHPESLFQDAAISTLAAWEYEEALPLLISQSRIVDDEGEIHQIIRGIVRLTGVSTAPPEQKVLWLRDAFDVSLTVDQKLLIMRALEANKTYNALLFAGRYLDDDQLKYTAATTVMNIALERKDFYGEEVVRMLNQVINLLSGSESSYLREAVQKHIAELPNGKGFIPLFNGKDLTGWKGLVGDPIKRGQMSSTALAKKQVEADKLMREGWYAEGGVLHFNGKGDNIATEKHYGDFELLVDWKLAKEGKDGDAGIYLRGTPQVQIWDTSRVEVGAQVGSGGLYNNQVHESKPLVVADNELGEWNTFQIKMVGDRVTVYLNGQLVTDSVVLENYWDRSLPIFPAEQIELQAHGTHVSYRDIYIRELPRKEIFVLSSEEKNEGFEVLFDGSDLDAWVGNKEAYVVSEEGTLAIYPTEGSGGNLYTQEEFGDFIYRFEFRLTPGANNGIGIRTPMEGDAAYVGMEIQILDDDADMYKNLADYQYHGSVYGIIPAERGHLKPLGEWNEQEIYIKGSQIRVTLNGTVIIDGDLAEASREGTLDKKKHPGLQRQSGHIAFLGHGSEVHFRNIRVKRL